MSIKIIPVENQRLTFEDVKDDQFFVDDLGSLCQKVSYDKYNIIADRDGSPCADTRVQVAGGMRIDRKLPDTDTIQF